MCASADEEDDEDDEDDYDPHLAFRHLSGAGLARWAPAMKGSRWMQSDSAAADEVRLLLASRDPLTLDSDALPPIYVSAVWAKAGLVMCC